MKEETKEQIGFILELLRKNLIELGVSMALYDNKIMFFDTETYLTTQKFSGIEVSIDDLVKENKR